MVTISTEDPVAVAVVAAIRTGDIATLKRLLVENGWLAAGWLGDDDGQGISRSLLHVVTDWPGHYPNGAATVATLVDAGADVDARFRGPHEETPLHWAASSGDVEVLDALLDAGADIEAPGAVLGGGSPMADARGFKQWRAAYLGVPNPRSSCSSRATAMAGAAESCGRCQRPGAIDLKRLGMQPPRGTLVVVPVRGFLTACRAASGPRPGMGRTSVRSARLPV